MICRAGIRLAGANMHTAVKAFLQRRAQGNRGGISGNHPHGAVPLRTYLMRGKFRESEALCVYKSLITLLKGRGAPVLVSIMLMARQRNVEVYLSHLERVCKPLLESFASWAIIRYNWRGWPVRI